MSIYLQDSIDSFGASKRQAERAIEQLSDEQLRWKPDAEANSVAILMRHLAGNMRSRWTDLLTTDGEKPWRQRDGEFIETDLAREELLADWESGWSRLFETLDTLSEADLDHPITIRGKQETVRQAILRQQTHYAFHVGQIVYIGRMLTGEAWRTLSIPKGKSADFLPPGS